MKKRLLIRNRRGVARRGVGFSLFVLLGMSTLLGFATQIASPQVAQAAASANEKKFRYLTYFDRCLDQYVDADGKDWDGNNRNIQFEDPKEMFKKGEFFPVGVDLDGENGVMSCYNIAHKAASYILGINDTEKQDVWLEKKIWGISTGENGGPIKVVGYVPDNVRSNVKDFRKQIAPMIASVKFTHTKRDTLERMQPMFEQCFKNLRASRTAVGTWEDGSLQYDNRKIFAERKRFDWDEIKLNGTNTFKIAGKNGALDNTDAKLGDIGLGFFTVGKGDGFNDRTSNWYPIGEDLASVFGDVAGIRRSGALMADCNIFSAKNAYFFGTSTKDSSTHWVIKNNKLQIAEDKNGDGKIEDSEITEAIPKELGEKEESIASTANGEGTNNYQCVVTPPLSWIACPIITLMVKALGVLEGAIENALEVPPLRSDGAFTSLHTTWAGFRDFANAFLVLIFLVTIFAQVLPFDVDPYMVKKVLPKIIAAAICIQFSYFFVQVMFDISRVLGGGVRALIHSLPVGDTGGGFWGQEVGDATVTSGIGFIGAIAAGGAGLAAAIEAASLLIVPILLLLLSAVISVITLFVTLQMRMIVIFIMTMIAPLAFLAWILPNTESYFKKWGTGLIKLLMMYPIIVFMIESANLISKVSYDAVTAMSKGGGGGGGVSDVSKIMISIIPIIIYFMIPMTFKWAGGIFASVAGAIQNQGGKWSKLARSNGVMKNSLADIKGRGGRQLAEENLDKYSGFGRFRRAVGNRVVSGNAFSYGSSGRAKMAASIAAGRKAQAELNDHLIEQANETNPQTMETLNSILRDGATTVTIGKKKTKVDAELTKALIRRSMSNGGDKELAQVINGDVDEDGNFVNNGMYDLEKGEWREGMRELFHESLTEAQRVKLLQKVPHAVHGKGYDVYPEMDASTMTGINDYDAQFAVRGMLSSFEDVKDADGKVVSRKRVDGANEAGANKLVANMINILRSSTESGKVKGSLGKSILKEVAKNPSLFDNIEVEYDGVKMSASDLLLRQHLITNEGAANSTDKELKLLG